VYVGEEACGEAVVLQALRSQESPDQADPGPVHDQIGQTSQEGRYSI